MKKLLIRTNEWFDKLPYNKAFIIYVTFVFLPYIILILSIENFIGSLIGVFWIFLVGLWRFLYKLIK